MLNFDELDKKFIVEYDEDKTCMFAYLWDKRRLSHSRKVCIGKSFAVREKLP